MPFSDAQPNAPVHGSLSVVDYDLLAEMETPKRLCSTLENASFIIPPGRYRLTVTYSPKFKRDLPLVNNVPKVIAQSSSGGAHQGSSAHPSNASGANQLPEQGTRSGIRFHPGTKPEHSRGCILVSREAEEMLKKLILGERETRLEIN